MSHETTLGMNVLPPCMQICQRGARPGEPFVVFKEAGLCSILKKMDAGYALIQANETASGLDFDSACMKECLPPSISSLPKWFL